MPEQADSPSERWPSKPAIRRASPLPGAADPGDALGPSSRWGAAPGPRAASGVALADPPRRDDQPDPGAGRPDGRDTTSELPATPEDSEHWLPTLLTRRPILVAATVGAVALITAPFLLNGGSRATATGQASNRPVAVTLVPGAAAPSAGTEPSPTASSWVPAPGNLPLASAPPSTTPTAVPAPPPPTLTSTPTAAPSSPAAPRHAVVTHAPVTATDALDAVTAAATRGGGKAGRHICYRVFATDKGWQRPVCDGASAGAAGQPVEAVEVATLGTGGVEGNSYNTQRGWMAKWTLARDHTDLVLGTAGQGVRLDALTLEVGGGAVCVDSQADGSGWQGQRCQSGTYVSTGTLGQSRPLESIRFTV